MNHIKNKVLEYNKQMIFTLILVTGNVVKQTESA
mgnify:CR=1 FL=1